MGKKTSTRNGEQLCPQKGVRGGFTEGEVSAQPPPGHSDGQLKKKAVAMYGAPADSTVVITATELQRLNRIINAKEAQLAQRADAGSTKETKLMAAAERKAKMQAIDKERSSRDVVKPVEEVEKEIRAKADISKAQMKMDEELDEVKYMNKVMLYTKCVTIRDAQIAEKQAIAYERAEEEKRQDMMMEMERLKALKMYEEREQKRIENRKRGAAVIRAQIEENNKQRLNKLELKNQEQEAMLRHIEKMKEDDRRERMKKKEAERRLIEDAALANAEQIRNKNRERTLGQEEDRRIHEYMAAKEQREQELAAEQEKIRLEKEAETARMRKAQEKEKAKKADLDALRAKRAQENAEREHRRMEKENALRVQAINEDLRQARERQKAEKEAMLAEQARAEHEEFEEIIAVQREKDDIDRCAEDQRRAKRLQNASELQVQIQEVEELRRQKRREDLDEGNRLKAARGDYANKVEAIRHRKLAELETCAVPEKYRNELMKKKNIEPLRPSK